MDETRRVLVLDDVDRLADQGMRVLALADGWHRTPVGDAAGLAHGLVFLGLVGIRDPPRTEAHSAVQECASAGIQTILITGDHPRTAQAVARELGIARWDDVRTGKDLEDMDDARLAQATAQAGVYARLLPEHKLRIVEALQRQGHVVAMTGDGVNDAPALRRADIGVAMGVAGTDVAKEAAGMVLADDDFATIVAAVEEGRAIFENVRKYLVYLLSTNFGELLLIAAAMALGLPLPLSAVMILYVNLASDGLPALALAVDPREPDLMRRPPRAPGRAILDRRILALMALGGIWSAATTLGVFVTARWRGTPLQEAMTLTFVTLVLIQFAKAYVFRSERHAITRAPFANKWLNRAVLWEVCLLALLVYVPGLQALFGTHALGPGEVVVTAAAALSVVPVLETAKWLGRKPAGQVPGRATA